MCSGNRQGNEVIRSRGGWCVTYLHGEDHHPCFVVDGECRAGQVVEVHILWPKEVPGMHPRCGTCGQRVTADDVASLHFIADQTYVPFSGASHLLN